MAVKLKANVQYQPIVESVSRKFVPRKETCSRPVDDSLPIEVEETGWMGGAVRRSVRAGFGACKRNFIVIRENARSSQPSTDELRTRETFQSAVRGRNHIVKDLSQLARIIAMWREALDGTTKTVNGVSPKGYTMNGWIMAAQFAGGKAAAEAGQSYNYDTFPNWDA